jgi:hypothetical protein
MSLAGGRSSTITCLCSHRPCLTRSTPLLPHRAVAYEEDLEASDPKEFLQQLPNIGQKRAAEMVSAFGPSLASIRDVLSSASAVQQLTRLPSITRSVAAGIKEAWDEEAGAS